MKLNKHVEILVKVMIKVVSRSSTRKFARDELCRQINEEVNDKRIALNKHQLPYVVKQQKEFEYKKNRDVYDFGGTKK